MNQNSGLSMAISCIFLWFTCRRPGGGRLIWNAPFLRLYKNEVSTLLNSNFQRYIFLCRFVRLFVTFVRGNMFTEKDYLGVRPLQVFDEFVALQEFVGALGRVCGV